MDKHCEYCQAKQPTDGGWIKNKDGDDFCSFQCFEEAAQMTMKILDELDKGILDAT